MKISNEAIHANYDIAKKVYEGKMDREEGIDYLSSKYAMNKGSAADGIQNFRCFINGKKYTRTNNAYATEYFLSMILKDYGYDVLKKALSATKQHIEYYEKLQGTTMHKIREIYEKFLAIDEVHDYQIEPKLNDISTEEECHYLFYMEKQLEDFLIENWDKTELSNKYELILDEGNIVSQQYRTSIGFIDILAKDKHDNRYVIIELKKNQTSDDTIGQLTRYMGWVEEHLSQNQLSKGIIIAGKYDDRLYYAAKKIPDVELFIYQVDFRLSKFNK